MYCQQLSKLIFAAITPYYDYNPKSKTSHIYRVIVLSNEKTRLSKELSKENE